MSGSARGVVEHVVEVARRELVDRRDGQPCAAAGSWASSAIERLAEVALHLPAQQVEVLGRRRRVARPGCCPRRTAAGSARGGRWSAPAPGPRSRAAGAAPGRCRAATSTRLQAMNWSMMTWAPLAKSPNWASHRTSVFGRVERVAELEAEHGRLGEQAVVDARTAPGLGARWLQRRRTARRCWRRSSTACRWLKVPRRLSWPLSRTGVPSSSSEPKASASANGPVDRLALAAASLRRASKMRRDLGVDVKSGGQLRRAPR